MNSRIAIDTGNAPDYFVLRRLTTNTVLSAFDCAIAEYNTYLERDAVQAQEDSVAVTWLLYERGSNQIAAYMSLIADAIKLNMAEKELHNLNYPFRTLPALKIAKLAVSASFKAKYHGIGSYMITLATGFAEESNISNHACRFITVDADIEHDTGVTEFYEKNGFIPNIEMNNKHGKTVNMRKDVLPFE
jgi:ribosomal protein S18 acetylase RimI-like enzyme